MRLNKHPQDEMTPCERLRAIEIGSYYDRIPVTPFIGNMRSLLIGVKPEMYEQTAENIVRGELAAYEHFGLDRLMIGPNTVGISNALKAMLPDAEEGKAALDNYEKLSLLEPVNAACDTTIKKYHVAAESLAESALDIVPIEVSIGGPFTIASFIRGIEVLLKDCHKAPEEVHKLLKIIVQSEKNCVDAFAGYGVGFAMADPVANPALIGPRLYEKFVYPYTQELTDYIASKTNRRVSLHMCGETQKIWKLFKQYNLNEISLDNVVDFKLAAEELGDYLAIAGNVDPVEILMKGTREDVFEGVRKCIEAGSLSKKGFHLSTGCDTPDNTPIEHMEWFMKAARKYGKLV